MGMTAVQCWKDKAGRNHEEGGGSFIIHPESSGGLQAGTRPEAGYGMEQDRESLTLIHI